MLPEEINNLLCNIFHHVPSVCLDSHLETKICHGWNGNRGHVPVSSKKNRAIEEVQLFEAAKIYDVFHDTQ
jgi:hypothetical protein